MITKLSRFFNQTKYGLLKIFNRMRAGDQGALIKNKRRQTSYIKLLNMLLFK